VHRITATGLAICCPGVASLPPAGVASVYVEKWGRAVLLRRRHAPLFVAGDVVCQRYKASALHPLLSHHKHSLLQQSNEPQSTPPTPNQPSNSSTCVSPSSPLPSPLLVPSTPRARSSPLFSARPHPSLVALHPNLPALRLLLPALPAQLPPPVPAVSLPSSHPLPAFRAQPPLRSRHSLLA
jgi:hypothetical protein